MTIHVPDGRFPASSSVDLSVEAKLSGLRNANDFWQSDNEKHQHLAERKSTAPSSVSLLLGNRSARPTPTGRSQNTSSSDSNQSSKGVLSRREELHPVDTTSSCELQAKRQEGAARTPQDFKADLHHPLQAAHSVEGGVRRRRLILVT